MVQYIQRLETGELKPHYVERPRMHPPLVSCMPSRHSNLCQRLAEPLQEGGHGTRTCAGNQRQNHPMYGLPQESTRYTQKHAGWKHQFLDFTCSTQSQLILTSHARFWQDHPSPQFPYHRWFGVNNLCLVELAMCIVGFITSLTLNITGHCRP